MPRRRLTLFRQFTDDLFRDRTVAFFVLSQHSLEWRLDVNDLDAGFIVGEQVEPSLPRLLDRVCSVECERRSHTQQLSAPFTSKLSDCALIVRWGDVEFTPNSVQGNDR
jgi:hypothetical protein